MKRSNIFRTAILATFTVLLVARANGYRVERFAPEGTSNLGPVTAYDPIPVTQAVRSMG